MGDFWTTGGVKQSLRELEQTEPDAARELRMMAECMERHFRDAQVRWSAVGWGGVGLGGVGSLSSGLLYEIVNLFVADSFAYICF